MRGATWSHVGVRLLASRSRSLSGELAGCTLDTDTKGPGGFLRSPCFFWLRGLDLNQRPLGYEPNELPDCSTPRCRGERYCHPGPLSSRTAARDGSRPEAPALGGSPT